MDRSMGKKSYGEKQRATASGGGLFLQQHLYCVCVCLIALMSWSGSSDCASLPLAPDEVNALNEMARELGKKEWNPEVGCSGDIDWGLRNVTYANDLNCTCSDQLGVCHMLNISIKGQDLAGLLPKSLAKLRYLKHIDLSRNYLNGTIPQEWTSMSLEYVSVIVNRLSGQIPAYLGDMTNLTYLSIENNNFGGAVPPELGKLLNLQNLTLTANYLTGQLPKALTKLSNLSDLRISSNNFSGPIPDYFQSWTALTRLEIQASGFKGPIPSRLVASRVQSRMLRNCKIYGSIPKYLPKLTNLKSLSVHPSFTYTYLNWRIPRS